MIRGSFRIDTDISTV